MNVLHYFDLFIIVRRQGRQADEELSAGISINKTGNMKGRNTSNNNTRNNLQTNNKSQVQTIKENQKNYKKTTKLKT